MVDASVGGKTGINFNGLKNEIGVFSPAESVLIDSEFLKSLDLHNLLSGYAEMLKHGLISTPEHWAELLNFDFNKTDYKAFAKNWLPNPFKSKRRLSNAIHMKPEYARL